MLLFSRVQRPTRGDVEVINIQMRTMPFYRRRDVCSLPTICEPDKLLSLSSRRRPAGRRCEELGGCMALCESTSKHNAMPSNEITWSHSRERCVEATCSRSVVSDIKSLPAFKSALCNIELSAFLFSSVLRMRVFYRVRTALFLLINRCLLKLLIYGT